MAQTTRESVQSFLKKLTIKKIVILSFSIIIGMVLVLGGISFHGIYRLNTVNELNQDSYRVFIQMNDIQDAMKDAEAEIRMYFSRNGWKSYSDIGSGAISLFRIKDEQLLADITDVGKLFWSVQLAQGPFIVTKGEHYKISFEAKSTQTRDMQVIVENIVNYQKHFVHTVELTPEMKTYTVNYYMNDRTDDLTQLMFSLGKISSETTVNRHQVYIDNVSLIEVNSGRELIKNGSFVPKDIHKMLSVADRRIHEAIRTSEELTSDSIEQRELLRELSYFVTLWYQNNESMIKELSAKIETTGNLSAGLELQSHEANVTSRTKIEQIINQIKQFEDVRLAERKEEAKGNKYVVYSTLSFTIFLSIMVFIGIYIYFNRAIIKPIVWTSELLRDMADDDEITRKVIKPAQENMDIAIYEVRMLHHHMTDYHKLLYSQLQRDGLTGLANRQTFDTVINEWIQNENPFVLMLIDIDYFKHVNDTWGHLAGDEVIKFLAAMMLSVSRNGDLCFRYGGEEFGMLIKGESIQNAHKIAERLRETLAVEQSPVGRPITISIGIARYEEEDKQPGSLIQRADSALYQSKSEGRNRTTIFLRK
jgi:diguanylate cyclase (GGDEF)-like protein